MRGYDVMSELQAAAETIDELFISDPHGEYDSFKQIIDDLRAPGTHLHMVGDVYDRGPAPDLIMDELASLEDCDI